MPTDPSDKDLSVAYNNQTEAQQVWDQAAELEDAADDSTANTAANSGSGTGTTASLFSICFTLQLLCNMHAYGVHTVLHGIP